MNRLKRTNYTRSNEIRTKETIVVKLICIRNSVRDASKQVVPEAPPEIMTRRHPEEELPRRSKSDSDSLIDK